jgi:hypothetical protein
MNIEFMNKDAEKENGLTVDATNPLKEMLVNYVGNKVNPENDEVTVDMIIETLAEDFPEFLLVVAEENWVRGYQQALNDVTFKSEGNGVTSEESLSPTIKT